jgi:hypothetical protein
VAEVSDFRFETKPEVRTERSEMACAKHSPKGGLESPANFRYGGAATSWPIRYLALVPMIQNLIRG